MLKINRPQKLSPFLVLVPNQSSASRSFNFFNPLVPNRLSYLNSLDRPIPNRRDAQLVFTHRYRHDAGDM